MRPTAPRPRNAAEGTGRDRVQGPEGYFLIVHDIVAFARSKAILCQSRGSAANSAVCYALKITAVDSIKYKLPFERFCRRLMMRSRTSTRTSTQTGEKRSFRRSNKDDCAYMGVVKFDLLGLGCWGAIQHTFDLVRDRLGEHWTLLHRQPRLSAGRGSTCRTRCCGSPPQ